VHSATDDEGDLGAHLRAIIADSLQFLVIGKILVRSINSG
jgi:hypothetical protein